MAKEKKAPPKKTEEPNKPIPVQSHFEIIGSKNRRIILNGGRYLDLRMGIPSDVLELYKSGCKYFGLKKGAEVLFEDLSKDEIHKLIDKAPRSSDKKILKSLI